ncbi:MAG: penicillin-binding protein 2 [Candidatus Pacebacteria bacterium]|nr:penicillin-binding protein 2 [Candidatus Paceibacterota bacterium]
MFEFKIPKNLKQRKVKTSFKEDVEPQEILLDALSQREDLFSQQKFETPIKKKTLQWFSTLFFILILSFLFKTFELQILKGKEFSDLSLKNYQTFYYERAERGVIYDNNLKQLVFNELSFDLIYSSEDLPTEKKEKELVLQIVTEIIKQDIGLLEKKLHENSSREVLIAENLDHESLILLESKIQELPGFYIEENIKRSYSDGPVFSQVIGFLGRIEKDELHFSTDYSTLDYIGKMGLEKSYENVLKGQKEKTVVMKNAKGQEFLREKVSEANNGNSLVLWLDSDLQKKVAKTLESTLERTGALAGAIIAMDPKTGGILSLVSLPSFDNNIFFQKLSQEEWDQVFNHPQNPFWNRAISAAYPTGSTIKPLIAVAALEENIISAQKNILCLGKVTIDNPWFPDEPWVFHDWTTHGWVDLKKAIAESCNVYFYTIGGGYKEIKGLGEQRIKNYLELFGWGNLTNIDLPGEKSGLIPDKQWKEEYFDNSADKIWVPGDTYNLSIGQGYLSITPLQVVSSFSAIANGGNLLKPQLVKNIIDEDKNVVQDFEQYIIRDNFIDNNNLEVVRQGMRDAVIYGSSVMLNDLPVKSAAKTGTAQTGKKDYYHNWVTVFAPYDDPEIVLTVIIENVPEEQVAALPTAKEILNWYFSK